MKKRPFGKWALHWLSTPFIYAVFVPVVFLDLILELYHRVCFPLYNIPYVPRRKYIRLDRHKLSYLTPMEKLNCVYCGYVNGFLYYAMIIVAETENYWCAIKHKKYKEFYEPPHHKRFVKFGDKKKYIDDKIKKRH